MRTKKLEEWGWLGNIKRYENRVVTEFKNLH
jgi:hypothetical protein